MGRVLHWSITLLGRVPLAEWVPSDAGQSRVHDACGAFSSLLEQDAPAWRSAYCQAFPPMGREWRLASPGPQGVWLRLASTSRACTFIV